MNRYKGRIETSRRGFVPGILDYDGDDYMDQVLDHSFVEYGTGCWLWFLDNNVGDEIHLAYEAQILVYQMFKGAVPTGHYVFNTCSDYRICLNPNCLDTLESPDYES